MAGLMFSSTMHEARQIGVDYSEPTHGLRFLDGRLQQAFLVTRTKTFSSGPIGLLDQSIEWRDVPRVDLADATKKETLP